jgi:hypothetical protein
LLPTIFFFISVKLIVLTTNLILPKYLAAFSNFMIATATALVVGKAVPVADVIPLLRWYDRAPLIQPILFKTTVYWAVGSVIHLLEHFVEFSLIDHNPIGSFLPHMIATFHWNRFAAIQIWILVLFLIYVTASEFSDFVRRRRAGTYPVLLPAVRATAEPATTDLRACPAEQTRQCTHGTGVPRSDQHRAPSAGRHRAAARSMNLKRIAAGLAMAALCSGGGPWSVGDAADRH